MWPSVRIGEDVEMIWKLRIVCLVPGLTVPGRAVDGNPDKTPRAGAGASVPKRG